MISAVLITLNEQNKIERALRSLQDLVDEIIIVDSGSQDDTLEIAKKYRSKIYFRKFDNFANQKNWAVSKAKGDWILALDADEEITADLAEEIKEAIRSNKYQGYLIPRRNFILGAEIKHSRWSPDMHIWLWKKDDGKWVGAVHEEVLVNGPVGLLKSGKIHHSHNTVSSFIEANNFYSTLEAQSMHSQGIKFSLWRMFWEAFFEFFVRFFYKKGFLDGHRGFALAYLMGIYKLIVWVKIYDLQNQNK